MHFTNTFKNIRALDIHGYKFKSDEFKFNLPKLFSLKISNISYLKHFNRLNSLIKIQVSTFDKIQNIDDVIDPSQIIEL